MFMHHLIPTKMVPNDLIPSQAAPTIGGQVHEMLALTYAIQEMVDQIHAGLYGPSAGESPTAVMPGGIIAQNAIVLERLQSLLTATTQISNVLSA